MRTNCTRQDAALWGRILLAVGIAITIWTSETKARETDCSSATQRAAMAEYDKIAEMVGIPPGAPIYTLEKRQYVAAVCLHEALGQAEGH